MVRLATMEDIDSIAICLNDAKRFLKASGLIQWNGPSGNPEIETYIEDIKRRHCYVCVRDGVISGVATFMGHENEYDQPLGNWLTNGNNYTTIHRIAVCDKARSQGVATELMRFAEVFTKNTGRVSIRIDTHPENLIVQTMLKSLGYTYCGYVIYSYIPVEPKRLIYEKLMK
ncbi:ribosomal protein S18 acetylase RimI-like enzyme [Anaeroplasma bactoclasticum]|jgi:ribosomal protein S18 acetylase RimI-like enzyme|uniref:Ribosomal protein S18 acetylase RimI-like enzyme n=1 Tax=Anaeroplasma bactoclasticum TaxID=2088 RepID=A0A397QTN6_9MOLU|nr:GNAT family N-acetyltransferase [Anaeroplasma bactoclasticum]RIA64783.1 ribosomal protein S18 acetylase RimI-like enzyme [Anaeroplasma bactoclasticum]